MKRVILGILLIISLVCIDLNGVPIDLSKYFNNKGFATESTKGLANFDGVGFSYPASLITNKVFYYRELGVKNLLPAPLSAPGAAPTEPGGALAPPQAGEGLRRGRVDAPSRTSEHKARSTAARVTVCRRRRSGSMRRVRVRT